VQHTTIGYRILIDTPHDYPNRHTSGTQTHLSKMTRRKVVNALLTSMVGSPGCSISSRRILAQLMAICDSGGFAIIGARLGLNSNNELVPSAIAVAGDDAGQLLLQESVPPHLLSLAPDGIWVAWVPESSLPDPYGRGGHPLVCITNDSQLTRPVTYSGWFGTKVALSSGAVHLALISMGEVGSAQSRRLSLIDPRTGESLDDLTKVISGYDLAKVERLRLSSSGKQLIVGWPDSFFVINLQRRAILLRGKGRFPSISPSGDEIAFVAPNQKLVVLTLATGLTREPLTQGQTYGVGSWTPDGKLLFAFVRAPLALNAKLIAIDCRTGLSAEITSLDEWNLGQNCALIKKRLLSATPRLSSS